MSGPGTERVAKRPGASPAPDAQLHQSASHARRLLPLLLGLFAGAVTIAGDASLNRLITTPFPVAENVAVQADTTRLDTGNLAQPVRPGHVDVRKTNDCKGCGIVESVRRIDWRETGDATCSSPGSDRFRIAGDTGTIEQFPTAHSCAGNVKVRSGYQFVVRFRDGSRRAFNEDAARAWQPGKRVLVIAGASPVAGEQ